MIRGSWARSPSLQAQLVQPQSPAGSAVRHSTLPRRWKARVSVCASIKLETSRGAQVTPSIGLNSILPSPRAVMVK